MPTPKCIPSKTPKCTLLKCSPYLEGHGSCIQCVCYITKIHSRSLTLLSERDGQIWVTLKASQWYVKISKNWTMISNKKDNSSSMQILLLHLSIWKLFWIWKLLIVWQKNITGRSWNTEGKKKPSVVATWRQREGSQEHGTENFKKNHNTLMTYYDSKYMKCSEWMHL